MSKNRRSTERKKKKGRQTPLNDVYNTSSVAAKASRSYCLCWVFSFLCHVPQAQDTLRLDPTGKWCPRASQGAEQNLAVLRQKAPNTSPSIKPQGSASPLSRVRASELRPHFNAFISHLICILVSHSGLFTSFQRQRYLKCSELAVEVLAVPRRKTTYTSLQGSFLIFLGNCGQMSDSPWAYWFFSCTWRCTLGNLFVLLVYFNLVCSPLPIAQGNGLFMVYICESSKMLSFTKKLQSSLEDIMCYKRALWKYQLCA